MSTEAISPLRRRMIEDMNSRKLGAHTQRSHIYSCKRFAAQSARSARQPYPCFVPKTISSIAPFQRPNPDTPAKSP